MQITVQIERLLQTRSWLLGNHHLTPITVSCRSQQTHTNVVWLSNESWRRDVRSNCSDCSFATIACKRESFLPAQKLRCENESCYQNVCSPKTSVSALLRTCTSRTSIPGALPGVAFFETNRRIPVEQNATQIIALPKEDVHKKACALQNAQASKKSDARKLVCASNKLDSFCNIHPSICHTAFIVFENYRHSFVRDADEQ